ncbi:unnamed protein product [Musa banksii]
MTCGGSSSIARKEGATPRVRSGSEGRGPHERHLLQRRRGGRAPCRQQEGVGQQGRRRRGRCRSRWEQGTKVLLSRISILDRCKANSLRAKEGSLRLLRLRRRWWQLQQRRKLQLRSSNATTEEIVVAMLQ